ncbi:c-type cytochrome [Paenibacillus eucommiae]|uniref:Cytochrome c551 n=1 Tax=Paenibacillus eucommiae TaxID=1355755 RepID=A0ABS4IXP7_9BACL|nr:cytochrome c [Paenibacillus eucommiae]MBP1992361.1 cytochrome c551 [Paenibacillus eucommiae]
MHKSISLLILMLLVTALSACGAASPKPQTGGDKSPGASSTPSAETNEAFVKAEELFQKTNCISCHGVDLSGRIGPTTNLQKIGASKTKEQIADQIRNGGGGMPVYKSKLTDDEINLLTEWLFSKK